MLKTMKKNELLRIFLTFIAVLTLGLTTVSCEKEPGNETPEPPDPEDISKAKVELVISGVTSSTVVAEITLEDAVKVYYSYQEGTEPVSKDQLRISYSATESIITSNDGFSPNTAYVLSAFAIDFDGIESEVVTTTFTTLEVEVPPTEFEGEFIMGRLMYTEETASDKNTAHFNGTFCTVSSFTFAGDYVYPDHTTAGGLLIRFAAYAKKGVEGKEYQDLPVGTYVIRDDYSEFTMRKSESYLTTTTAGSPATYSIESGKVEVSKSGDTYNYVFDLIVLSLDEENPEPQEVYYTYTTTDKYQNIDLI